MWNRLPITILLVGVVAAPPNPPVSRPVEGTIQLVGRMRVARAAATATTIAGDRVVIVGGMTESGGALREFEVFDASTNRVVASGEAIFDPRTARFAAAGSMNVGRSGHTATRLDDGTVLITGGVGDGWSFLASAEVYDPRTRRFTQVKSMSFARESHTATLLRGGKVLIAGGHRDRRQNIVVYASTEIYDPAQREFNAGPMLTTARHKHDAAGLADGRVLVIGGSDPRDRTRFTSAEVYDPVANRWIAVSRMRIGRYKLRDGGHALVLDGYDNSMRNSDGIWRFRE